MRTVFLFLTVLCLLILCTNNPSSPGPVTVDPCDTVTCLNGGTCVDGVCHCPAGYTGNRCQTAVDPCAGITCQNGGTCSNGVCSCPQGYTGTYCQTQQTPVSIVVTKIVMHAFPVLNDANGNWDPFGGKPDPMIQLAINDSVFFTSGTAQDATEGFAIEYTNGFPVVLNRPTSRYQIWVWDDDLDADDYMGGYNFTAYNSTNGFPSRLRLDSDPDLDIELYVTYQF
jgi:hypothetical protein